MEDIGIFWTIKVPPRLQELTNEIFFEDNTLHLFSTKRVTVCHGSTKENMAALINRFILVSINVAYNPI